MKKRLLLGTALLAAISAFSQTDKVKPSVSPLDLSVKLALKYQLASENAQVTNANSPIGPVIPPQNLRTSIVAPITWTPISGSMNIFGMLVQETRPLQYNDELNAVSFVHRASKTFPTSPPASPTQAASGVQVAMVTTDWGVNWDSTCIWNNNTQWGRFPTGGLYNPPGNTNMSNVYAIGGGQVTSAAASPIWIGNWIASKQLDIQHGLGYDNVASTVPNAQQFFSSVSPYNLTVGKFDAPTQFSSTDDGEVRMISRINTLAGGTTLAQIGYRGAKILKGAFSSGVFNWTMDTIIPPNISHGGGFKNLNLDVNMAWNESGTVGYIVFMGTDTTRTLSNRGIQPIIYKTTNSGGSWVSISGIDFNHPSMKAPVLDHIPAVRSNSNLTIPRFNTGEGVDIVVDKNDKLHIVSTIVGSPLAHKDSSFFGAYNFTLSTENEIYSFGHVPGQRPYIYDFYQDVNDAWKVVIVDSMSTEEPGITSGSDGYNDNPWDADPSNSNVKRNSNARIQTSRTPDGKFIVYTWAESDTSITNSNHKWNHIPNLKARVMDVTTGTIHPKEIDLTNPLTGGNPLVKYRAQMHYISPKCGYVSQQTNGGPVLILPATVSNNQNTPLTQLQPNTHWYTSARLEFGTVTVIDTTSVHVNELEGVNSVVIFPNPAKEKITAEVQLSTDQVIELSVYNLVGQKCCSVNTNGHVGENKIDLNLNNLNSGVYFVKIKAGNSIRTNKLIIE